MRIRFRPGVAYFVERSRWHPSQKIRRVRSGEGAIELTMDVALTVELKTWVMSFGEDAEVLEPAELREDMAQAARGLAAVYGVK